MIVNEAVNLAGAVVLCEALVELFLSAKPLAWLRRLLKVEDEFGYPNICGDDDTGKGCAWYSQLAGCGYCLSFWVGQFIACTARIELVSVSWLPAPILWIGHGILVHRLSNVWHGIVRRSLDTEGRLRRGLEMVNAIGTTQDAPVDASPEPQNDALSQGNDKVP